ncbi:MAG: hypothetical protein MRERV_7c001, partial [Mycoplasmataceae bacterium RV_VA103A]
ALFSLSHARIKIRTIRNKGREKGSLRPFGRG